MISVIQIFLKLEKFKCFLGRNNKTVVWSTASSTSDLFGKGKPISGSTCTSPRILLHAIFNPIWPGGSQNGPPPTVFAKYLKNGLANLYETLLLLRPIYRSSLKIKSLRIGHSLSSW